MLTPLARSAQTSPVACINRTKAFLGIPNRTILARTARPESSSQSSSCGLRRSNLLRRFVQGSSILLAAGSLQSSFVSMSAAADSKAAQVIDPVACNIIALALAVYSGKIHCHKCKAGLAEVTVEHFRGLQGLGLLIPPSF